LTKYIFYLVLILYLRLTSHRAGRVTEHGNFGRRKVFSDPVS